MTARSAPGKKSRLEQACAGHRVRMTGHRRNIARVLSETADHPDIFELHRRVASLDRRVSLATVYRTVKLFETLGILERHQFRGERSRIEPTSREHHDHLIDVRSGRVIEFRSDEIERLQAVVAKRLGYRILHHRLELYGIPDDDEA